MGRSVFWDHPCRPSNKRHSSCMKSPWLVAIAILPLVGAPDSAGAMTYKDIAGQWCGDVTDYVFAPDTLTVKFHDARPANMFKITKYTYTNDAYVLIGSTVPAKSQSRFSLSSAVRRWRSRRTTENHAEPSIAAETSSYLEKEGANLRGCRCDPF